jgi:hypothetical protein
MILAVYPPDGERQVVSRSPNESLIVSTVESQPWEDITGVTLEIDDQNHLTLSGSLSDGLAAVWFEDDEEHLAFLNSLDEGLPILLSYFRGDNRWREEVDWE